MVKRKPAYNDISRVEFSKMVNHLIIMNKVSVRNHYPFGYTSRPGGILKKSQRLLRKGGPDPIAGKVNGACISCDKPQILQPQELFEKRFSALKQRFRRQNSCRLGIIFNGQKPGPAPIRANGPGRVHRNGAGPGFWPLKMI